MNSINNNKVLKWVIYKITSPSGRVYIGKTCNPKKRFRAYRSEGAKSQPLIYRSLRKYGFKNHAIEIIDSFDGTNSYSSGKEMFWIRTYMSNYCKWPSQRGMNVTDGGKSTLGWNPSPETRKKMSDAGKGKKVSDATKKFVSEFMKGHKYNLGKKHSKESIQKGIDTKRKNGTNTGRIGTKHSEESKLKMSIARKGVKRIGDGLIAVQEGAKKRQKPISQFDLEGNIIKEYPSIKEASQQTGVWFGTIIEHCMGRTKKSRLGCTFKYKENAI